MSDLPDKETATRRSASPRPSPKKSVKAKTPPPDPLPDHKHLPDYEEDGSGHKQPTHILRDLVFDIRFQIVAGILLICFTALLAGPPIYRKIKIWRAHHFMDRCEEIGRTGNLSKAMNFMRQAIILAPGDEEIFRRIRLFNAGGGENNSLAILQDLMLQGQAQPDELLVLAEQSIKARKTAVAKEALKRLATQPSARRAIVEMRLTSLDGNLQAAVDLARASMKDYPPSDAEKISLAAAELVLKTNPEISQQILAPISNKNTENGLAALRLLATQQLNITGKNSPDSATLAKALESHPLHSINDTLQAAELRILAKPESRPAILAGLASHFSTQKIEDQLAFARWLNNSQFHKQSIDFIGRERALSNTEWLLIYLDALAGLDRWNDIFTLLDENSISGLSDSVRLMFLARSAQKSGDSLQATENWTEMQRTLLYEKPEVVSFIASYTFRIGETEQASKVFKILSSRRETALEGFLGLIRCTPKNSPAADIIPLYIELLEVFPNMEEARNDLTYLQLITNQNLFDASFAAHEALKKSPNSLAAMSLSAVAHLKNNDPALADAIYKDKLIPWSTAPDPWKNVRAAVLYATGKKSEADELVSTIDKNQLRPEERALLPAD